MEDAAELSAVEEGASEVEAAPVWKYHVCHIPSSYGTLEGVTVTVTGLRYVSEVM